MKKIGLMVGLLLALVACSRYTSNAEDQYLKSRNGVSLVVSPPLTDSNISQFYYLPSQSQDVRVNIKPPALPIYETEKNHGADHSL